MRLFAAIVPPRPVLEEVVAVLDSVRPVTASPEPAPRPLLRRLVGRGAPPPPPAEPLVDRELDRPPLEEMHIPLTSFGNVTLGDSIKLANALRAAVAGWPRAEVSFAGAAALEFKGDESVWARLTGDLDAVNLIGRGVPQVVQRLGFFVDRRVFRPWLSVGTITDETTAPYLESVVAALDAFRGRPWTLEHVHLMRWPPDATGASGFEVMEPMPLAGDA
jgi:RNA 2',3'-cyclic 3'-phosphodiesterase